MGNNKSKPQINSECPICYVDSKNKWFSITMWALL